ncbi:carbon starvation induced protein CsiD [Uliginosibacterium sp. TH139]|uniref:carbon starvation induced protein CsiD n=1 Tax=Uliginosibacterium sp. TH139 TaxID=2067453 RepID=UPI00118035BB|nr:carbon starvation induced protein CsiD [Uliginosibacterium sp. TH139]
MLDFIVEVEKKGYLVLDEANLLTLAKCEKFTIIRDVIISDADSADTELVASRCEFPFHTDGTFLTIPPKYVVIIVKEAQSGGQISLSNIDSTLKRTIIGMRAKYRSNTSVFESPIYNESLCMFRYRRDFMSPTNGMLDSEFQDMLDDIESKLTNRQILVGKIDPGYGIILNNHNFVHKRSEFAGRRVIRRIWLDINS